MTSSNAAISTARGDYASAAIDASAAATGPVLAGVATGRRIRALSNAASASDEIGETVGDLRAAGKKDAHHIAQDAAMRDVPGYKTNAAPGVALQGPSNKVGTSHNAATAVQRQRGGGTFAAERRIAYKALRRAGYTRAAAREELRRVDAFARELGLKPNSPTRIPGNRPNAK